MTFSSEQCDDAMKADALARLEGIWIRLNHTDKRVYNLNQIVQYCCKQTSSEGLTHLSICAGLYHQGY
jgi:hypothetical protein